jgi:hypothetical protein
MAWLDARVYNNRWRHVYERTRVPFSGELTERQVLKIVTTRLGSLEALKDPRETSSVVAALLRFMAGVPGCRSGASSSHEAPPP